MRRAVLALGALVLVAGIGLGIRQVASLAGEEVDASGDLRPTSEIGDEPLVRARLREGQEAFFEVCAEDAFAGDWDDVAFEVWHLGDGARAQVVPAERWGPRVQRSADYACVMVVQWESVLVGGEYGLRVAGTPAAEGRIQGRMAAWRSLDDVSRSAVALVFLGGLLLLLGLALPAVARPFATDPDEAPTDRFASWSAKPAWVRVGVALAGLLFVMVALSTLDGTALGLVRALGLALSEVVLAWICIAPGEEGRVVALGLARPRPGWWVLVLLPVLGLGVWLAGAWLAGLIPSTGLSPVEAFVSYPSGSLALGVVAVIVPIAEELFFRGFVYGAVERRHGRALAFTVAAVVFALAHLPQQWGAWGPFAAVAFTGVVLTALRATTRSIYPSAVAHLTHNALITALALA